MIKLEIQFTSGAGGFASDPLDYKQIIRNDKYAVYERSRNGQVKDYEVFKIKIDPKGKEQKFPNGTIKVVEDDTEKYPSNTDFGRSAWSFTGNPKMSYLAAIHKYNDLNSVDTAPDLGEVEETTEATATTDIEAGVPKRKRKARASVVFPTGKQFTMKDLLDLNPDYSQPTMYIHIQAEIKANKVVEAGEVQNHSGRGKKPKLYALV